MSNAAPNTTAAANNRKTSSFRNALVRGLAIVSPPLLTIVLLIWAWNTIDSYVFQPLEAVVRAIYVAQVSDVFDKIPQVAPGDMEAKDGRVIGFRYQDRHYVPLQEGQWINRADFEEFLALKKRYEPIPTNAYRFYERYVETKYLQRHRVIPVFLALFVLVLYLLGKLMAFSVGRMLWAAAEWVLHRLPLVRNVYSSVKQVTDLVIGSEQVTFRPKRVVAVEYPSRGIWQIAFVVGEGFQEVFEAAGEPIVSLLVPTSPAPMTGFAVMMRKSDVVDLNISIDQALQFIVSCGVVAPSYVLPPGMRRTGESRSIPSSAVNDATALTPE